MVENPKIVLGTGNFATFPYLGLTDRFNCYSIGFSKNDICIHLHSQEGGLPDHSPLASQVRVLFPLLRMYLQLQV